MRRLACAVRVGRLLDGGDGVCFELALDFEDGALELGVDALGERGGVVEHFDIGGDAFPFNDPAFSWFIDSERGDGDGAAVDEGGATGHADEAAPCAGADDGAQLVFLKQPRETIAARTAPPIGEHHLRALGGDERVAPVGAVADAPVMGDGTVEEFDEAVGDLAACIPAFIDDESFLVGLAAPLTVELVLSLLGGVCDVDVRDFSVGLLLHVAPVAFDPCEVTEFGLGCEGFEEDETCAVEGGAVIDGELNGAFGKALERGVNFFFRVDGNAVDRKNPVAGSDIDSGL